MDTIENLKAQLDEAAADNKAAFDTIRTQQGQLVNMMKSLSKSVSDLQNANPAPSVKEVKKERPSVPTKTFKSGENEYKFVAPAFKHPVHGEMTAQEALGNQTVLDALVKEKSGVIQEVEN